MMQCAPDKSGHRILPLNLFLTASFFFLSDDSHLVDGQGLESKPPAVATQTLNIDASPTDLSQLKWLCGTWLMEDVGKSVEEHWRPIQGTTILGMSHTFDVKRSYFFEYLRIELHEGQIYYVALPAGQNETKFKMVRSDQQSVEFENPQHDYPQKIRYEKTDQGITAIISLLDGGRTKKFQFKKMLVKIP